MINFDSRVRVGFLEVTPKPIQTLGNYLLSTLCMPGTELSFEKWLVTYQVNRIINEYSREEISYEKACVQQVTKKRGIYGMRYCWVLLEHKICGRSGSRWGWSEAGAYYAKPLWYRFYFTLWWQGITKGSLLNFVEVYLKYSKLHIYKACNWWILMYLYTHETIITIKKNDFLSLQ